MLPRFLSFIFHIRSLPTARRVRRPPAATKWSASAFRLWPRTWSLCVWVQRGRGAISSEQCRMATTKAALSERRHIHCSALTSSAHSARMRASRANSLSSALAHASAGPLAVVHIVVQIRCEFSAGTSQRKRPHLPLRLLRLYEGSAAKSARPMPPNADANSSSVSASCDAARHPNRRAAPPPPPAPPRRETPSHHPTAATTFSAAR